MWPVLVVLVVGALDMWRRGTSFRWGTDGGWVGAGAGLVALAVAELVTGGWSEYPIARGSVAQALAVALVVAALAFATELALRGWLVERLRAQPGLAVLAGAIAEALITPGDLTARIGAGVFGAGLGWMYITAGLRAPVCARLSFALGALVLDALQFVG